MFAIFPIDLLNWILGVFSRPYCELIFLKMLSLSLNEKHRNLSLSLNELHITHHGTFSHKIVSSTPHVVEGDSTDIIGDGYLFHCYM